MKNFFKKETEADKVKNEIDNSILKKNSIISAIEMEKNGILNQKNNTIFNMGQHAYECFKESKEYDFSKFVEEIESYDEDMVVKDSKIADLQVRYDEEIALLYVRLEQLQPPMPPQGMPQQGMQQQGMQQQGMQQQGMQPQGMPPQGMQPQGMPPQGMPPQGMPPQGMPPQGNVCGNCNNGTKEGDMFCENCGNKLQ